MTDRVAKMVNAIQKEAEDKRAEIIEKCSSTI